MGFHCCDRAKTRERSVGNRRDLAAGEAERFPRQDVNSHFLSGTDGSLTLPRLEFWHYRDGKGWHDELTEERTAQHLGDPYAEQMRHFRGVVEGEEEPICSAADAMRSWRRRLQWRPLRPPAIRLGCRAERVHGTD